MAETAGIAYQREVLIGGGTDAWLDRPGGGGFLAGCISVPSRYIHSAVGCVHLDDLDGAVSCSPPSSTTSAPTECPEVSGL